MYSRHEENVITVIEPVVSRIVFSRIADEQAAYDIVQDVLVNVAEKSSMLEDTVLASYAAVAARNAIAQHFRESARENAALESLARLEFPSDSTELTVLKDEERNALLRALESLDAYERELLVAHHLENTDLDTIAARSDRTRSAVALQLSRARAKMRVKYVLATHNVQLPTLHCETVLMAMSSGDKRAQVRANAAAHLSACAMCADVTPQVLRRSTGLAAVAPIAIVWEAMRYAVAALRQHPLHAVGAGATGAAATALLMHATYSPPAPVPAPASQPVIATTTSAAVIPTSCAEKIHIANRAVSGDAQAVPMSAGNPVKVEGARVYTITQSGFWIGCGEYRLWVANMHGADIIAAQRAAKRQVSISFDGVIREHSDVYAHQQGLDALLSEQLSRARYHADVEHFVTTNALP